MIKTDFEGYILNLLYAYFVIIRMIKQ